MTDRKVIRLADLGRALGAVELPGGKVVDVVPINGVSMQLHQQMLAEGQPTLAWAILEQCCPGATSDELLQLNIRQATQIVEIASGSAREGLDEMGKGTAAAEGPGPASAAPPTS